VERIYKALRFIEKNFKKRIEGLDVDSNEYVWTIDELIYTAKDKYKLSDDEEDCFEELLDILWEELE